MGKTDPRCVEYVWVQGHLCWANLYRRQSARCIFWNSTLGSLGACLGFLSIVVKTWHKWCERQKSGQVWLAKKREVKARDDVINLAQVSFSGCSGCSWCSGELTKPRVSRGWSCLRRAWEEPEYFKHIPEWACAPVLYNILSQCP